MNNLQLVRTMLSDSYKDGFDDITADDESKNYKLSHSPVKEGSVIVQINNNDKEENEDYTVDYYQGLISFSDESYPQNKDLLEVQYKYSVFSDGELNEFLEIDGSVDRVVLRCLEILLIDSSRRFDYEAGQTNIKAGQIFLHLNELIKYYRDKISGSESSLKSVNRRHNAYRGQGEFIGDIKGRVRGDLTRDEKWSDNNV